MLLKDSRHDMDFRAWLFIGLAAVAFYNLWVRMLMNGTLESIDTIKASRILPGGKPLLTTYTGVQAVDDGITTLVIFFDPLLDAKNPSGRILMLDVLVTLHSAIMWLTVESQRQQKTHWLLNLTAAFGFLWNAAGAAVVLPIYCFAYFLLSVRRTAPPILPEAKALIPALLLTSYAPMAIAMGVPLFFGTNFSMVQRVTAAFQFGPVIFVTAQKILSLVMPQMEGACKRDDEDRAMRYTKHAYLTTACVCGLTHLFCLGSILFDGHRTGVSFASVYWPRPDSVVPGSESNMPDGSLLFMHYDNMFIALTCVVWSWLVLRSRLAWAARQTAAVLVILSTTCLVFGPGAVVGIILYYTEETGSVALTEGHAQ